MDIVDKIANAKVKTSGNGEASTPLNPVKVTTIDIKQTAQ
jgi:cyclophilin family peptidyl-prolyl cis-trans isomerase